MFAQNRSLLFLYSFVQLYLVLPSLIYKFISNAKLKQNKHGEFQVSELNEMEKNSTEMYKKQNFMLKPCSKKKKMFHCTAQWLRMHQDSNLQQMLVHGAPVSLPAEMSLRLLAFAQTSWHG